MEQTSLNIDLTVADFATDFVAGLFGGSAGLIVGHPFDTLKILLQTSKSNLKITSCCQMIIRQEGMKGFFKGMAYPLASVGFLNSVFFGFNMIADSKLMGITSHRYSDVFIAGAIAGAIQAIPATPIELVKIKLQCQLNASTNSQMPRYCSPWDCLRQTFRDHNIRGLYRGITCTMLRDVTGFSVYMTTYKIFCDLGVNENNMHPPLQLMLLAGGIAGVLSWIVNFPVDTIKSIMQSDDLRHPQYRNSWHCYRSLCIENGYRVLWKGFMPAIFRAFPVNAVTLCTYDWTQQRMKMSLKKYDIN